MSLIRPTHGEAMCTLTRNSHISGTIGSSKLGVPFSHNFGSCILGSARSGLDLDRFRFSRLGFSRKKMTFPPSAMLSGIHFCSCHVWVLKSRLESSTTLLSTWSTCKYSVFSNLCVFSKWLFGVVHTAPFTSVIWKLFPQDSSILLILEQNHRE